MSLISSCRSEAFSPILYRNHWPDIPFPRILELKLLAESIPSICPSPSRYSETRLESINRSYQLHWDLDQLLAKGVIQPHEVKVLLRINNQETAVINNDVFFISSLELLGSEAQRRKWVPLAKSHQFLGCYAQTELAHGSDVADLETVARYDPDSQEFVLNTPSVSSTKWLIGGLGKTATHALVFAQLKLGEKNYGVHCFFTQIRCLQTHDPLPGVEVGDIGPKYGWNTMDNGFLRLSNVRVPRDQMLMRLAEVTSTGQYVVHNTERKKLMYSALLFMRIKLAADSWYHLARAATIAIRYSGVRRQFRTYPTDPTLERPIIDYQYQAFRLIPIISQVYAMNCGGGALSRMMKSDLENVAIIDSKKLALLHCLSCALKAVYTWTTVEQSEVCRQCCGGHGFSCYSGLPQAYRDYIPTMTVEGDNAVLSLQAARYLVKLLNQPESASGIFSFLREKGVAAPVEGSLSQRQAQAHALEACVFLLALEVKNKVQTLAKAGQSQNQIWSSGVHILALKLTKVVAWQFTHTAFLEEIAKCEDLPTKRGLEILRNLFALSTLYHFRSVLLRRRLITTVQAEDLLKLLLESIAEVKSIRDLLIDGFSLTDAELNSALGRKDGKAYETLLQWAQEQNPLNSGAVFPPVLQHLRSRL